MRHKVDREGTFLGEVWVARKKRPYWFGYSVVAVFDELAEAELCAELMELGT